MIKSISQLAGSLVVEMSLLVAIQPPQPHPTYQLITTTVHSLPLCSYVQGLFTLALDPSAKVKRVVCTGLVKILLTAPERLEGSMPQIIEYMLQLTQVGRCCLQPDRAPGAL